MAHLARCAMVFNLLCGRGWPGEVLKLMKNDQFQVSLAVWVGKFLGNQVFRQVKECFILALLEIVKTLHIACVPNEFIFSFVIKADMTCRLAETYENDKSQNNKNMIVDDKVNRILVVCVMFLDFLLRRYHKNSKWLYSFITFSIYIYFFRF